jgi:hypothetical protein
VTRQTAKTCPISEGESAQPTVMEDGLLVCAALIHPAIRSLGSVGALAQSPIGFVWRGLGSVGALAQSPIGFVWRGLASVGALAQSPIGFVAHVASLVEDPDFFVGWAQPTDPIVLMYQNLGRWALPTLRKIVRETTTKGT